MSDSELRQRVTMEQYLIKSNQLYLASRSAAKVAELATKLCLMRVRADVDRLRRAINLLGRRRKTMLGKCFSQWAICVYEKQIEAQEEEIVRGEYLQESLNRRILQRAFAGWLKLKFASK